MRSGGSKWPAWMVALMISIGGGVLCVLFYFVIPELGIHGLPAGEGSVRLLAPLTLLFSAICYASLFDEEPRRNSTLHPALAGVVGGVACVFVLHAPTFAAPITLPAVALGAAIGVVLAVAGVFGFVARGL